MRPTRADDHSDLPARSAKLKASACAPIHRHTHVMPAVVVSGTLDDTATIHLPLSAPAARLGETIVRRLSILVTGLTLALVTCASAQDSVRLTGSGATFPFPLYSAWFKAFGAKGKAVTVDYQGKGSGAGIQDFLNRTVDFAASDAAMTDEDMAKVQGGVQLLPMTAGEIVIAYNLPGNPKGLKLPRDVYAGIFLGKVTKWSDPKLKAANPGINLPDNDITVVRRADSSGTTFVFTTHLSAISEEWK